jgi:general secretion pathway protein G
MRKLYAIALLFTLIFVTSACASKRREQERSLRATLTVLRDEIAQFTVDHRRPPTSLQELLSAGYMKQIPSDPFTARNDTWQTETAGADFRVHSGSTALGSNGIRYSSW